MLLVLGAPTVFCCWSVDTLRMGSVFCQSFSSLCLAQHCHLEMYSGLCLSLKEVYHLPCLKQRASPQYQLVIQETFLESLSSWLEERCCKAEDLPQQKLLSIQSTQKHTGPGGHVLSQVTVTMDHSWLGQGSEPDTCRPASSPRRWLNIKTLYNNLTHRSVPWEFEYEARREVTDAKRFIGWKNAQNRPGDNGQAWGKRSVRQKAE